jgi:hypothetical protein
MCLRYMRILAYYISRSGYPGLACQSTLKLRSEEQEICYTRNSYTEIGGGEVGKEDYGKVGRVLAAAAIQIY